MTKQGKWLVEMLKTVILFWWHGVARGTWQHGPRETWAWFQEMRQHRGWPLVRFHTLWLLAATGIMAFPLVPLAFGMWWHAAYGWALPVAVFMVQAIEFRWVR